VRRIEEEGEDEELEDGVGREETGVGDRQTKAREMGRSIGMCVH